MIGLRRVVEAVQAAAHRYGIERLAGEFDRRASTLYSEVNYHLNLERKAKLGLLDTLQMIQVTGDHSPLQAIAAAFNYMLVPIGDNAGLQSEIDGDHLRIVRAVMDFLEAAKAGEDYVKLHARLELIQASLESVWIKQRARHVPFAGQPEPSESAQQGSSWWRRWTKRQGTR